MEAVRGEDKKEVRNARARALNWHLRGYKGQVVGSAAAVAAATASAAERAKAEDRIY